MLHVACVRWGQKFGVEYVERLHDMVRRNLPEGFRGRFVCLTDRPQELKALAGVEPQLLPAGLMGWWNKLALFHPDAFPAGDRVLYLDLDTLIVGPLDKVATFDSHLAVLHDAYRPAPAMQTSVMFFRTGTRLIGSIWEEYLTRHVYGQDDDVTWPGGDQGFIEAFYAPGDSGYLKQRLNRSGTPGSPWPPDFLQDHFPGVFRSYKKDCVGGPPRGTSVVFFHGHPRPHEVREGWVPQVWDVGAGSSLELVMVPNVAQDVILANVRAALADSRSDFLELSEAHEGRCLIVGGGPSLAAYLPQIALMQKGGAVVLATNATLGYLRDHGIIADAHVVCDASPHTTAWYRPGGKKLYASMVDPGLIEAAHRDPEAELTLWHPLTDGVPELVEGAPMFGGGSTVAMRGFALAYGMGFRRFNLFGVDSCYQDGLHHAYPQAPNDGERVLDCLSYGKTFKCAPWMIQQADDFKLIAYQLLREGCEILVFGEGLIPWVAAHLAPLAVDERAEAILSRLPQGPVHGVELGVFAGDLSRRLLARADLSLLMVDDWSADHPAAYKATGDYHTTLTADEQEGFREMAERMTDFAGGRREILRERTVVAAGSCPDRSLDFVFIDADHSYEGVTADILAWRGKVKAGGLLCGHDYDNPAFAAFGVKRAVDELCGPVELGANYTWFKRIAHE